MASSKITGNPYVIAEIHSRNQVVVDKDYFEYISDPEPGTIEEDLKRVLARAAREGKEIPEIYFGHSTRYQDPNTCKEVISQWQMRISIVQNKRYVEDWGSMGSPLPTPISQTVTVHQVLTPKKKKKTAKKKPVIHHSFNMIIEEDKTINTLR